MNIKKKQKREKHDRRWHEMYQSHHGCAAWRGEERTRIENSGQLEMHCDWCAVTGYWMTDLATGERRWHPRDPCRHPGYYLEYKCQSCRYRCHSPEKARNHSNAGHKIKLARIYWRIKPKIMSPEPIRARISTGNKMRQFPCVK